MTAQDVLKKFMASLANHGYSSSDSVGTYMLDSAIRASSRYSSASNAIKAMVADQTAAEKAAVTEVLGSSYNDKTIAEVDATIRSADAKTYSGTDYNNSNSNAFLNNKSPNADITVEDVLKERMASIFLKTYCGIELDTGYFLIGNDKSSVTSYENKDETDTGAITGKDAGGTTAKTAKSVVPETFANTYKAADNASAQTIVTNDRNWVIQATDNADQITANGADSINAGAGDDKITVNASGTTVTSGTGSDTITVASTVNDVTFTDLDESDTVTISGFEANSAQIVDGLLVVTDKTGTRKIRFGNYQNAYSANINSTTVKAWLENAGIDLSKLTSTTYAAQLKSSSSGDIASDGDGRIALSTVEPVEGTTSPSKNQFTFETSANTTGNVANSDTTAESSLTVNGISVTNVDENPTSANVTDGSGNVLGTVSSEFPNAESFTRNGLTIHLLGESSNSKTENITAKTFSKLDKDQQTIVASLFKWWAGEALKLNEESYNLGFNSPTAAIKDIGLYFYNDAKSSTLAAVNRSSRNADGEVVALYLNVNMKYYSDITANDMDGTGSSTGGGYLDRTLAHEFTHAIMGANINFFGELPQFIKEGSAELTHGIDDERGNVIFKLGYSADSLSTALSLTNNSTGDEICYAGGYMFFRWLAKHSAEETLPAFGEITATVNVSSSNGDGVYYITGDSKTETAQFATTLPEGKIKLGTVTDGVYTVEDTGIHQVISGTNKVSGLTVNDTLTGTDNADTVTTAQGSNISSGAGDDEINVYGQFATINAGAGSDTVNIKDGSHHSINLGDGNNLLNIVNSTNTLHSYNNTITGGSGNDSVIDDASGKYYEHNHVIDLGDGNNNISFYYGDNLAVTTGTGNDVVTTGGGKNNTIVTGKGNDSVYVGDSNSTIIAGDGDDTVSFIASSQEQNVVELGGGSNVADIRGSQHTVTAGTDNDSIKVIGNHNSVSAGAGDDTITVSKFSSDSVESTYSLRGSNYIDAGDGNDYITLSLGQQTIVAGAGNDSITQYTGSNGGNVYLFDTENFGNDRINGFMANDTIKLADGFTAEVSDAQKYDDGVSLLTVTVKNGNTNTGTIVVQTAANVTFDEATNIVSGTSTTTIDGLTYNDEGYYEISSVDNLKALATYVNNGNDCDGLTFKVTENIDMKDATDFVSIGNSENSIKPFKGTFDGADKTIGNLNTDLFGNVDSAANITNVRLLQPKGDLVKSGDATFKDNYYYGDSATCNGATKVYAVTAPEHFKIESATCADNDSIISINNVDYYLNGAQISVKLIADDEIHHADENYEVTIASEDVQIKATNIYVSISGNYSNSESNISVLGGDNVDQITNTGSNVTISSGAGDDTIGNSSAKVTIDGGTGSNIINLSANTDTSTGEQNVADIVVKTGSGANTIATDASTKSFSVANFGEDDAIVLPGNLVVEGFNLSVAEGNLIAGNVTVGGWDNFVEGGGKSVVDDNTVVFAVDGKESVIAQATTNSGGTQVTSITYRKEGSKLADNNLYNFTLAGLSKSDTLTVHLSETGGASNYYITKSTSSSESNSSYYQYGLSGATVGLYSLSSVNEGGYSVAGLSGKYVLVGASALGASAFTAYAGSDSGVAISIYNSILSIADSTKNEITIGVGAGQSDTHNYSFSADTYKFGAASWASVAAGQYFATVAGMEESGYFVLEKGGTSVIKKYTYQQSSATYGLSGASGAFNDSIFTKDNNTLKGITFNGSKFIIGKDLLKDSGNSSYDITVTGSGGFSTALEAGIKSASSVDAAWAADNTTTGEFKFTPYYISESGWSIASTTDANNKTTTVIDYTATTSSANVFTVTGLKGSVTAESETGYASLLASDVGTVGSYSSYAVTLKNDLLQTVAAGITEGWSDVISISAETGTTAYLTLASDVKETDSSKAAIANQSVSATYNASTSIATFKNAAYSAYFTLGGDSSNVSVFGAVNQHTFNISGLSSSAATNATNYIFSVANEAGTGAVTGYNLTLKEALLNQQDVYVSLSGVSNGGVSTVNVGMSYSSGGTFAKDGTSAIKQSFTVGSSGGASYAVFTASGFNAGYVWASSIDSNKSKGEWGASIHEAGNAQILYAGQRGGETFTLYGLVDSVFSAINAGASKSDTLQASLAAGVSLESGVLTLGKAALTSKDVTLSTAGMSTIKFETAYTEQGYTLKIATTEADSVNFIGLDQFNFEVGSAGQSTASDLKTSLTSFWTTSLKESGFYTAAALTEAGGTTTGTTGGNTGGGTDGGGTGNTGNTSGNDEANNADGNNENTGAGSGSGGTENQNAEENAKAIATYTYTSSHAQEYYKALYNYAEGLKSDASSLADYMAGENEQVFKYVKASDVVSFNITGLKLGLSGDTLIGELGTVTSVVSNTVDSDDDPKTTETQNASHSYGVTIDYNNHKVIISDDVLPESGLSEGQTIALASVSSYSSTYYGFSLSLADDFNSKINNIGFSAVEGSGSASGTYTVTFGGSTAGWEIDSAGTSIAYHTQVGGDQFIITGLSSGLKLSVADFDTTESGKYALKLADSMISATTGGSEIGFTYLGKVTTASDKATDASEYGVTGNFDISGLSTTLTGAITNAHWNSIKGGYQFVTTYVTDSWQTVEAGQGSHKALLQLTAANGGSALITASGFSSTVKATNLPYLVPGEAGSASSYVMLGSGSVASYYKIDDVTFDGATGKYTVTSGKSTVAESLIASENGYVFNNTDGKYYTLDESGSGTSVTYTLKAASISKYDVTFAESLVASLSGNGLTASLTTSMDDVFFSGGNGTTVSTTLEANSQQLVQSFTETGTVKTYSYGYTSEYTPAYYQDSVTAESGNVNTHNYKYIAQTDKHTFNLSGLGMPAFESGASATITGNEIGSYFRLVDKATYNKEAGAASVTTDYVVVLGASGLAGVVTEAGKDTAETTTQSVLSLTNFKLNDASTNKTFQFVFGAEAGYNTDLNKENGTRALTAQTETGETADEIGYSIFDYTSQKYDGYFSVAGGSTSIKYTQSRGGLSVFNIAGISSDSKLFSITAAAAGASATIGTVSGNVSVTESTGMVTLYKTALVTSQGVTLTNNTNGDTLTYDAGAASVAKDFKLDLFTKTEYKEGLQSHSTSEANQKAYEEQYKDLYVNSSKDEATVAANISVTSASTDSVGSFLFTTAYTEDWYSLGSGDTVVSYQESVGTIDQLTFNGVNSVGTSSGLTISSGGSGGKTYDTYLLKQSNNNYFQIAAASVVSGEAGNTVVGTSFTVTPYDKGINASIKNKQWVSHNDFAVSVGSSEDSVQIDTSQLKSYLSTNTAESFTVTSSANVSTYTYTSSIQGEGLIVDNTESSIASIKYYEATGGQSFAIKGLAGGLTYQASTDEAGAYLYTVNGKNTVTAVSLVAESGYSVSEAGTVTVLVSNAAIPAGTSTQTKKVDIVLTDNNINDGIDYVLAFDTSESGSVATAAATIAGEFSTVSTATGTNPVVATYTTEYIPEYFSEAGSTVTANGNVSLRSTTYKYNTIVGGATFQIGGLSTGTKLESLKDSISVAETFSDDGTKSSVTVTFNTSDIFNAVKDNKITLGGYTDTTSREYTYIMSVGADAAGSLQIAEDAPTIDTVATVVTVTGGARGEYWTGGKEAYYQIQKGSDSLISALAYTGAVANTLGFALNGLSGTTETTASGLNYVLVGEVGTMSITTAAANVLPDGVTINSNNGGYVVDLASDIKLTGMSTADSINISAAKGSVNAGAGNDLITIAATATDAYVDGGAGNDSISVAEGAKGVIKFGAGNDTINIAAGGYSNISIEGIYTTYTISAGASSTNPAAITDGDVVLTDKSGNKLTLLNAGGQSVTFLDGEDGFTHNFGADYSKMFTFNKANTSAAVTSLYSGASLGANEIAQVIGTDAAAKVVTIDASKYSTVTNANATGLYIEGNALDNYIVGTALNDSIDAGVSKPTTNNRGVVTALGNNTVAGGAGNDLFFYNDTNNGNLIITDFGTGTDSLQIGGTIAETGEEDTTTYKQNGVSLTGIASNSITFTLDGGGTIQLKDALKNTASLKVDILDESGTSVSQNTYYRDGRILSTDGTEVTLLSNYSGGTYTLPSGVTLVNADNTTAKAINASAMSDGVEIVNSAAGNTVYGGKGNDTLTGATSKADTFIYNYTAGGTDSVTNFEQSKDQVFFASMSADEKSLTNIKAAAVINEVAKIAITEAQAADENDEDDEEATATPAAITFSFGGTSSIALVGADSTAKSGITLNGTRYFVGKDMFLDTVKTAATGVTLTSGATGTFEAGTDVNANKLKTIDASRVTTVYNIYDNSLANTVYAGTEGGILSFNNGGTDVLYLGDGADSVSFTATDKKNSLTIYNYDSETGDIINIANAGSDDESENDNNDAPKVTGVTYDIDSKNTKNVVFTVHGTKGDDENPTAVTLGTITLSSIVPNATVGTATIKLGYGDSSDDEGESALGTYVVDSAGNISKDGYLQLKSTFGSKDTVAIGEDIITVSAALTSSGVKIKGGEKTTYLIGGSGADSLALTEAGVIVGNDGADTLVAAEGLSATLTGGKGNDIFVYNGGEVGITDYGLGNDTVLLGDSIYAGIKGVSVAVTEPAEGAKVTLGTITLTLDGESGDTNVLTFENSTLKTADGISKEITFVSGTGKSAKSSVYTFADNIIGSGKEATVLANEGTYYLSSLSAAYTTLTGGTVTLSGVSADGTASIGTSVKLTLTEAGKAIGGSKADTLVAMNGGTLTGGRGTAKDVFSITGGNSVAVEITDYDASDVIYIGKDFGSITGAASLNGNTVAFTYTSVVAAANEGNAATTITNKLILDDATNTVLTFYENNKAVTRWISDLGEFDGARTSVTLASGVASLDAASYNKDHGTKIATVVSGALTKAISIQATDSASFLDNSGGASTVNGMSLLGGKGKDTIYAGSGGDYINGGAGNDVISLGAGTDSVVIGVASVDAGNYLIKNYDGTNDVLLFAHDSIKVADAAVSGSNLVLTFEDTSNPKKTYKPLVTLQGAVSVGAADVQIQDTSYKFSNTSIVAGGANNSSLVQLTSKYTTTKLDLGSASYASIDATAATKVGTIIGGASSTYIRGNKSANVISVSGGSAANASFEGGAGNDTFIYGGGSLSIVDYSVGTNKVSLTNGFSIASVTSEEPAVNGIEGVTVVAGETVKSGKSTLTPATIQAAFGTGTSNGNILNIAVSDTSKAVTFSEYNASTKKTTSTAYTFANGVIGITKSKSASILTGGEYTLTEASLKAYTKFDATKVSSGGVTLDGSAATAKSKVKYNLIGGASSSVVGGAGADTLFASISSSNSATLTGGEGKDVFVYDGGSVNITDYKAGTDRISLGAGLYIEDVGKNNDGFLELTIGGGTSDDGNTTLDVINLGTVESGSKVVVTTTTATTKNNKTTYKATTSTITPFEHVLADKANGTGDSANFNSATKVTLFSGADSENAKFSEVGSNGKETYSKLKTIYVDGALTEATVVGNSKANTIILKNGGTVQGGMGKDTFSIGGGSVVITDFGIGATNTKTEDGTIVKRATKVNGTEKKNTKTDVVTLSAYNAEDTTSYAPGVDTLKLNGTVSAVEVSGLGDETISTTKAKYKNYETLSGSTADSFSVKLTVSMGDNDSYTVDLSNIARTVKTVTNGKKASSDDYASTIVASNSAWTDLSKIKIYDTSKNGKSTALKWKKTKAGVVSLGGHEVTLSAGSSDAPSFSYVNDIPTSEDLEDTVTTANVDDGKVTTSSSDLSKLVSDGKESTGVFDGGSVGGGLSDNSDVIASNGGSSDGSFSGFGDNRGKNLS